ncbi:Transposon Ty3-G Gag-Pol polyprotein [Orchesella cincta]|uniref:RNA-directed DNA polymerase n=1 Tax=Orchesella cincta TaxID=48709 RepID=A0A1D2M6H5_ORCCI|nr:Transposon Ty3-G Gag-Pol polyprotein [Orchesella cincta]
MIRVTRGTLLPPRCEVFIPIQLIGVKENSPAIIMPNKRLLKTNNILIPHMMVSEETKYVSVLNPTNSRKYLCKDTLIGRVTNHVQEHEMIRIHNGTPAELKEEIHINATTNNDSDDEKKLAFQKYDKSFNIGKHVSQEGKEKLFEILYNAREILSWSDDDRSKVTKIKYHMEIDPKTPIQVKGHRMSDFESEIIEKNVKEMLEKGVISPSNSPFRTYGFLVKQLNEFGEPKYRFVLDFRKINSVTRQFAFPLANIDQIHNSMKGKPYISCIDLKNAYHQIPLDDESKEYTAFATRSGLYHFNVIPFGIRNAPSGFTKIVSVVLDGLLDNISVYAYIDDLIIATETEEEHIKKLGQMFEKLKEYGLMIKATKANFMCDTIKILGMTLSPEGFKLTPPQIKGVQDLPVPKSKKDVMSVLGLFNYYHKFIKNYSKIAQPICKFLSLKPKEKFVWNESAQLAFDQLKSMIASPPILRHFIPNTTPAIINTDASFSGLGAAISQVQDGEEHPIAFISRSLTKTERNYTVTELECLAIVWAMKKLRHLVFGQKIQLITDHMALCHLVKSERERLELPSKLVRMLLYLKEFDIETIKHQSGKFHKIADCLSRYPTEEAPEIKPDSDNIVDLDIMSTRMDNIRKAQENDVEVLQIKSSIMTGILEGKLRHCFLREGVLLYKRPDMSRAVTYLPKTLRWQIVEEAHNSLLSCHPGVTKTYQRVSREYFWLNMRRQINHYVLSCPCCQKAKHDRTKPNGMMQMVEVPANCFQEIQVDIAGPFSRTPRNNKYLLTVSCSFSRYIVMGAMKQATSEQIAKFLVENVFLKYGICESIQSDMGTNLISNIMKDVNQYLGITQKHSSGYNFRAQSITERSHDAINSKLRTFVSSNTKDWDLFIPYIAHAINTAQNETTTFSPFFLLHGYDCRLPSHISYSCNETPLLSEINERFLIAREFAQQAILANQEKMAERYDARRKDTEFKVGDKVLVRRMARTKGIPQKLQSVYIGPFTVIERNPKITVNYLVEMKTKHRAQRFWCHAQRLRKFLERDNNILQFGPLHEKAKQIPMNNDKLQNEDTRLHPRDDDEANENDINNASKDSEVLRHTPEGHPPTQEEDQVDSSQSVLNSDLINFSPLNLRPQIPNQVTENQQTETFFTSSIPKDNQQTLIVYFIGTGNGEVPPTSKLSTGLYLQQLDKIVYEASTVIVYEMELPDIGSSDFLKNHTCTGNQCRFFNHIKVLAYHTMNLLQDSLPRAATQSSSDIHERKPRSIDFIASGLNFCCGVAEESQVNELIKNQDDQSHFMEQIKSQLSKEHDNTVRSNTILNAYSKHMNEHLHEIENKTIVKVNQVMNATNNLEDRVISAEEAIALQAKLLHRTTLAIQFSKVISDCKNGLFPTSLVSEDELEIDLEKLQDELNEHGQVLAIPIKSLHAFLFTKTTKCFFQDRKLIIKVNIPVHEKENSYKIFEVNALPFADTHSLCTVQVGSDFIAEKNKKEIITLQGQSKERCISTSTPLCHIERYQRSATHNTKCLQEIMQGISSVKTLKEHCTLQCSPNDGEIEIFQLTHNKFGVINAAEEIHITCKDGKNSTQKIRKEERIGIHIITLRCGCIALIKEMKISPDFPCRLDDKAQTDQRHIIHVLPGLWSMNIEQTVLSHDSYFTNLTALYDKDWSKSIPTLNLTEIQQDPYELPIHVEPASYLAYVISGIVIIIIIALCFTYKKVSSFNPSNFLTAIYTMLLTRPTITNAFPLTPDEKIYLMVEVTEIVLLTLLVVFAAVTFFLLKYSNLFHMFKNIMLRQNSKGKVRLAIQPVQMNAQIDTLMTDMTRQKSHTSN